MPPTRAAARNTACGLRRRHPLLGLVGPAQVDLVARRGHDLAALALQATHKRAADHAAMAGDPDPLIAQRVAWAHRHYLAPILFITRRSASTISATRSGKLVRWRQPSLASALAGSPSKRSTSVGRRYAPIDRHQNPSGAPAAALLVVALAAPFDGLADVAEGELDEFAHGVRLAGRQHVVVGLVLLQDPPHALDIVAGVAPVALGVEIAEIERLLVAELDRRHRARDLAGDEGLAADRAIRG